MNSYPKNNDIYPSKSTFINMSYFYSCGHIHSVQLYVDLLEFDNDLFVYHYKLHSTIILYMFICTCICDSVWSFKLNQFWCVLFFDSISFAARILDIRNEIWIKVTCSTICVTVLDKDLDFKKRNGVLEVSCLLTIAQVWKWVFVDLLEFESE